MRSKAIARQYYTLFNWEARNANQFFGLFGEAFKASMDQRVKDSEELQTAIRAFLEVGNERNKLVHQDYANFPLDKTLPEIYGLYQKALTFVELFPSVFHQGEGSVEDGEASG